MLKCNIDIICLTIILLIPIGTQIEINLTGPPMNGAVMTVHGTHLLMGSAAALIGIQIIGAGMMVHGNHPRTTSMIIPGNLPRMASVVAHIGTQIPTAVVLGNHLRMISVAIPTGNHMVGVGIAVLGIHPRMA